MNFTTASAQLYCNHWVCRFSEAAHGKLVTSVKRDWRIALRLSPHELSYVHNIHSFTLECLQKQMNARISCKIYRIVEDSWRSPQRKTSRSHSQNKAEGGAWVGSRDNMLGWSWWPPTAWTPSNALSEIFICTDCSSCRKIYTSSSRTRNYEKFSFFGKR